MNSKDNAKNSLISKSLSNKDIHRELNGKVMILTNSQLHRFKNGRELWDTLKETPIALLYEQRLNPTFGHWIGILKTRFQGKPAIEVFDSYGKLPDTQTTFYENDKKLTKLLLTVPRDIEITYNHFHKQKYGKDINTCGRWVVKRFKHADLPLQYFNKKYKNDYDII